MDKRLNTLQTWLKNEIKIDYSDIAPASADASFRRYFRVTTNDQASRTLIAMDAPPEHEDNARFIHCATTLRNCGLNVPHVLAHDLEQGFLLLSDLGTKIYQQQLTTATADRLYTDALEALLPLQVKSPEFAQQHPSYTAELLLQEMDLFDEWYIQQHLQSNLTPIQQTQLQQCLQLLIDNALQQPQVLVHRDYHCRNLLVTDNNNPGIIDFQDMVVGPITYDLVSLLKDCYIQWPRERVLIWLESYRQQAIAAGLLSAVSQDQWVEWFDWMGVQRHLKVLGIFARLFHRDGKPQYLDDLPLVNSYLRETCQHYKQLQPLAELLDVIHE